MIHSAAGFAVAHSSQMTSCEPPASVATSQRPAMHRRSQPQAASAARTLHSASASQARPARSSASRSRAQPRASSEAEREDGAHASSVPPRDSGDGCVGRVRHRRLSIVNGVGLVGGSSSFSRSARARGRPWLARVTTSATGCARRERACAFEPRRFARSRQVGPARVGAPHVEVHEVAVRVVAHADVVELRAVLAQRASAARPGCGSRSPAPATWRLVARVLPPGLR